MDVIAHGITELKVCRAATLEKDRLIEEQYQKMVESSQVAFWQEPTFIVGGLVVTGLFTAGLTAFLIKKK